MKHEAGLNRRLMNRCRTWSLVIGHLVPMMIFVGGCRTTEVRPVDIFPEDNCTQCRMAISDERFASEIIDLNDEAVKFDDIGCMFKYRARHADLTIHAIFLKDYDTKQWARFESTSIVETNVETPMGSGKVAFADMENAKVFQKQHPKIVHAVGVDKCCE